MWCLVSLPGNNLNVGVKRDRNSIAAECLNKVCSDLGIICEMDYFGLLYATNRTDEMDRAATMPNEKQWINLRNPLQRRHSSSDRPLMLELRVKFWVPGNLILQERVRDIFYAQAKQMLLDGEIHASNWTNAARLSALMAQAEGIKYVSCSLNEDCFKLNEQFIEMQNRIKRTTTLNKQNKQRRPSKRKSSETPMIAIESNNLDSLGDLKNVGHPDGSATHIDQQIPSTEQERQTGLPNCNYLKNYLNFIVNSVDDNDNTNTDNINGTTTNENNMEIPKNYLQMISKEHQKIQKMSTTSAKYWFLEEFALLRGFGEELFEGETVLSPFDNNTLRPSINTSTMQQHEIIQIIVSPQGLQIKQIENKKTISIPFTAVESAKSVRRLFHLKYLNEDQEVRNLVVKFTSHRIASALYRALTEKHAFYSCETVRSAVQTQFIRDLKGTIVSMFNEDTELGKRYVFDIQRTCREVYDNSRRILHQLGIDVTNRTNYTAGELTETTSSEDINDKKTMDLTCQLCMNSEIDTLFLPCGHVSCCEECAKKCDRCPLCRTDISTLKKVYLPMKAVSA